jgi:hypothetical protein
MFIKVRIANHTQYRLRPKIAPLIRAIIKVNRAEPTTDHTIGNVFPPTLMANISGRPNL